MNQLFKDLSVDKIKLIYEFDKTSPLFSRVALFEINQGNYLFANEILEKGLEAHPDYPTAFIIYALAKAYAGDEHRAKEALEEGMKFLSSPGTLKFYENKIDQIIAERNSLTETKRPAFVNENDSSPEDNSFFNIDDRLELLAKELSNAKIKVTINEGAKEEAPLPEYAGKIIASETLAKIYVAQKNYDKAISVYKELIKLHPEKENIFMQKIVELETLML